EQCKEYKEIKERCKELKKRCKELKKRCKKLKKRCKQYNGLEEIAKHYMCLADFYVEKSKMLTATIEEQRKELEELEEEFKEFKELKAIEKQRTEIEFLNKFKEQRKEFERLNELKERIKELEFNDKLEEIIKELEKSQEYYMDLASRYEEQVLALNKLLRQYMEAEKQCVKSQSRYKKQIQHLRDDNESYLKQIERLKKQNYNLDRLCEGKIMGLEQSHQEQIEELQKKLADKFASMWRQSLEWARYYKVPLPNEELLKGFILDDHEQPPFEVYISTSLKPHFEECLGDFGFKLAHVKFKENDPMGRA
ncbi:hypothetical protein EV182_000805, partial [Spiromyces aspiralis]